MEKIISVNSREETYDIGRKLGKVLGTGDIVMLDGALGAGKTVITKGICESLGVTGEVFSPTYAIMNEYQSPTCDIYHYDAYRLSSKEDLYDVGFFDNVYDGISIVEWAGNVFADDDEADNIIRIQIKRLDDVSETAREITISLPEGRSIDL